MRVLLVLLLLLIPNVATAQPHVSPHLMLARMCAHEASLPVMVDGQWMRNRDHTQPWGADCYLIHTVLLRGATRMGRIHPRVTLPHRYVSYAAAYSHGRILNPPATDGNRWAANLNPAGREPAGWHGLPWVHMRPAWLHVYELAGRIIHTTLEELDGPASPFHCDEHVTDWGGPMDVEHARSIGLIEVHCDGSLGNIPYRRP